MPRFRIQSNLHLDGFQMLDACLENVTSFEGLDDRNTGRIVFLNGSSSNKSNLHPAVFYGNEFKGLAYLDDIDKITNGEGSLGTRVKALEDMLGLQDVTNVIDTWNDVQEFFKNVDEGLNLMTMLDGKAEWSAHLPVDSFKCIGYGTIDADWMYNGPALSFGANSTYYAQLQINFQADQIVFRRHTNQGFSEWQTLIHSGNALDQLKGTFLPLTGGTISSGSDMPLILKTTSSTTMWLKFVLRDGEVAHIGVNKNYRLLFDANGAQNDILHSGNVGDYALKNYNNQGAVDYNNVFYNGIQYISGQSNNTPIKYGILMSTSIGDASWQLLGGRINEGLYFRGGGKDNTTWGDWKQIAFMDSTVEAANRLANKVSLWGNEFDGTKDIAGGIYFPQTNAAFYATSGEDSILFLQVNPEQNLLIGQGIAKSSKNTLIYGNNIKFCYGTAGSSTQTAMTITDGGNVNIGTAFEGFKFSVYGGMTFLHGVESSALVLGQMPTNGLLVGNTNYGIGQWFQGGQGHIQASSFGNTTATAYALNLNPLGGEVNVGSVNSTTNVKGDLNIDRNINVKLTATFNNGIELIHATPYIDFHFGNSSDDYTYRIIESKSGVLSFSGGLNVVGAAIFNGGALIPTGQKLTIGDATIEYDSIAKAIKVDGNLFTTGTNASGGKADAQQGGTGGNAEVYRHDLDWGEQVYEIQNVKGDVNVNVQVYEWNGNGNSWDMILTDVSVTANIITVTFGRPTSVDHMVTVV